MASQFGKSESDVRMWETDRSKPDVDTLIKLANYFDCTTDYLLGLSEFRSKEKANETRQELRKLDAFISSDAKNLMVKILDDMVENYQTLEDINGVIDLQVFFQKFFSMNEQGQKIVCEFISDLAELPKYQKVPR